MKYCFLIARIFLALCVVLAIALLVLEGSY